MGNCFRTQKKSAAEISPCEMISKSPVVKLHGRPGDNATAYVRFALLYKPVTLHFVHSDTLDAPVIHSGNDVVSGPPEYLLRYLDAKFPEPQLTRGVGGGVLGAWFDKTTPLVVWVAKLQHRSVAWHLERMVRWAEDLAARGGKTRGDPAMGTPRMEVRKFGSSYSQLFEMMLEHAQMEEKVLFPILDLADPGLCKTANAEHARDLPMMNGIKEDIKSIGVMDSGTASYQEALSNLSTRLKRLQEHCKEHFEEEERELLPLMEATELSKTQQEKALQQCLEVMPGTHSRLFRIFMEGLIPHEAMHYLDMIIGCSDKHRVSSILHKLIE